MSSHTIIESLSAYEAVRNADPGGDRVWWTTSPFLLIRLPALGEVVRSPEEGLPGEEFDALARAGGDLVGPLCAALRDLRAWDPAIDLERLFGAQVARCFFVTFYKGHLLDRILAAAAGELVECAGDPDDPRHAGLSLIYGRLDTLFARLASIWPGLGIKVVRHQVSKDRHSVIDDGIRLRRLGADEKLLSLLNNTPSSLVYKAWRNLVARHLWPWRGVSFHPRPRRTIHILKDSELIEEAFLGILLRGGRVTRLPKLPQPDLSKADIVDAAEAVRFKARFRELCRDMLAARGLAWRESFEPCVELAGSRIVECFAALHGNLEKFESGFSKISATMRPGDDVLSSSINGLPDRLFADHCRRRGIRVNTVDHGVTLGLSEWSLFHAAHSGMGVGTRGFYHCSRAVDAIGRHVSGQEAYAVGLPRITARPPFHGMQRRLARRMLDAGRDEHLVMIVCDLDRNNYIYGPQQDNDLQYLTKTRQIAETVCTAFPNSRVVLKLYPTQRYLDEYDFSDIAQRFANLQIVKNIEFRFLRTAADFLLTTSTQSTLGWVSGAGVSYLYLDFAWSPGRIAGLRLDLPGVDGLIAAVLPDAGQVCGPRSADMAEVLLGRGA